MLINGDKLTKMKTCSTSSIEETQIKIITVTLHTHHISKKITNLIYFVDKTVRKHVFSHIVDGTVVYGGQFSNIYHIANSFISDPVFPFRNLSWRYTQKQIMLTYVGIVINCSTVCYLKKIEYNLNIHKYGQVNKSYYIYTLEYDTVVFCSMYWQKKISKITSFYNKVFVRQC